MPMKTTYTLLACLCTVVTHAQVFSSGFEEWVGAVPLGWLGEQNTLAIDSIEQVDIDVHGGSYAVRLRNASEFAAQFTTQVMHVDSGETYTVSYWARGTGELRLMLYDANPWGGYSPLGSSPENIDSPMWEYHTRNILCMQTCDVAEFTFRARVTLGPEHLVIDDVNVAPYVFVPPPYHSIQEIQTPTGGGEDSPFLDSLVTTSGVVTGIAIGGNLYFLQSGQGPYSGIEVFGPTTGLDVGHAVTVYGTVLEVGSAPGRSTRITNLLGTVTNSTGNPPPEPEVLAVAELPQEQWESVLVHAEEALTCINDNGTFWAAITGPTFTRVGHLLYAATATTGATYSVSGIQHQTGGDWRLEPRGLLDLVLVVGMEEAANAGLRIYPNPATELVYVEGAQAGASYTIVDATGRVILQGILLSATIDLVGLSEGYYSLLVHTGWATFQTQLLIR